MLVPGLSPDQEIGEEVEIGTVEVVERGDDPGSPDRFALEEAPVVVTSMVEEDVDAFLAALEQEEIGAQRGELMDDGGVPIVVHASNLVEAQAVLVEFTGDVGLVDDIAVDPEDEGPDREMAVVTSLGLKDVGVHANRLRANGVDVRIELPGEAERWMPMAQAVILVPVEELERAREILRIAL
jgi:hypothetical protein